MHITLNLHTALLHLRNRHLERVLWVDAICINQDDETEKGRQISRMSEIYHKASRVVVWLGGDYDESDDEGVLATGRERAGGAAQGLRDLRRVAATVITSEKDLVDTTELRLDASGIKRLLRREWFTRIWVLQEVAVARNILVKCGRAELDGHAFALGLDALASELPDVYDRTLPIVYLVRNAVLRRPLTARAPPQTPSRGENVSIFTLGLRSLGELLYMYREHRASQRRDKIFALLGLARIEDAGATETHLMSNYSMPWRELLENLVFVLIAIRLPVSIEVVSTIDQQRCPSRDPELATLTPDCWFLGIIVAVDGGKDSDNQFCEVHLNGVFKSLCAESSWALPPSPDPIRVGDLIFLPRGAAKPVVVRPERSYLFVVLFPEIRIVDPGETVHEPSYRTYLVWDWEKQYMARETDASRVCHPPALEETGVDDVGDWLPVVEGTAFSLIQTKFNTALICVLLRLVGIYERKFGEVDLRTLGTKDNLARAYMTYGAQQWREAENLMKSVVRARVHLQGAQHPNTLFSRLILVAACNSHLDLLWDPSLTELEIAVEILETRTIQGSSTYIPSEDYKFLTLLKCFDIQTAADLIVHDHPVRITREFVRALAGSGRSWSPVADPAIWWRFMSYLHHSPHGGGKRVSLACEGVIAVLESYGGSVFEEWHKMLIRSGVQVEITERILLAAVGMRELFGNRVAALIDIMGATSTITEAVVIAAVRSWPAPVFRTWGQTAALEVLLEKRRSEVIITEGVMSAVGAMGHHVGPHIMERLLGDIGMKEAPMITEAMILQAAKFQDRGVLDVLLERNAVWKHVDISDMVVETARRMLFDQTRKPEVAPPGT